VGTNLSADAEGTKKGGEVQKRRRKTTYVEPSSIDKVERARSERAKILASPARRRTEERKEFPEDYKNSA